MFNNFFIYFVVAAETSVNLARHVMFVRTPVIIPPLFPYFSLPDKRTKKSFFD